MPKRLDSLSRLPCSPVSFHSTLVANCRDVLQNPDLIFENIARVKRLVDTIKYRGPVAFAGDCTKLRPRLSYSNSFGGHVLGTTLPLEECKVDSGEDIEGIIKRTKDSKAVASQVRTIMAKVVFVSLLYVYLSFLNIYFSFKVPIPVIGPGIIVALLPMTGNDNATAIHA